MTRSTTDGIRSLLVPFSLGISTLLTGLGRYWPSNMALKSWSLSRQDNPLWTRLPPCLFPPYPYCSLPANRLGSGSMGTGSAPTTHIQVCRYWWGCFQLSTWRSALHQYPRVPPFSPDARYLSIFSAFLPSSGNFHLLSLFKVRPFPYPVDRYGTTASADFSQ